MNAAKPFLRLDASVSDDKETHEILKREVEYNRVMFEFPQGFAQIPLIEECRALNDLEDFDLMYDITMQMLVGKPVKIYLRDANGKPALFEQFMCTDRHMDLRGVQKINEYPIIVNWLVSFVARYIGKKYPRPSQKGLRRRVFQKAKKIRSRN